MPDADRLLEQWMDTESEYRTLLKSFLKQHHARRPTRDDAIELATVRAQADKYRDRYFRGTLKRS